MMENSRLNQIDGKISNYGDDDETEEEKVYNDKVVADNFWDKSVTRRRRLSDWKHMKPMPSLILRQPSTSTNKEESTLTTTNNNVSIKSLMSNIKKLSQSQSTTDTSKLLESLDRNNNNNVQQGAYFGEDIIKVWSKISHFIIDQMKNGFGVDIPGLCTITIQEEKVSTSSSSTVVRRTPLMILSRTIVHTYKILNLDEYTKNDKAKVVRLDVKSIAKELETSQRMVEEAITEVLQSFARAIFASNNDNGQMVEFPLINIGQLQIQNGLAKMNFKAEFCKRMKFDIPKPNRTPSGEVYLFFPESKILEALELIPNSNDNLETSSIPIASEETNEYVLDKPCSRLDFIKQLEEYESWINELDIEAYHRHQHDHEEDQEERTLTTTNSNSNTNTKLPTTDQEIIQYFLRKDFLYPHDLNYGKIQENKKEKVQQEEQDFTKP